MGVKCLQTIIYVPLIVRNESVHVGEQSLFLPDKARTKQSEHLSYLARSAKEVSELFMQRQEMSCRIQKSSDVLAFDLLALSISPSLIHVQLHMRRIRVFYNPSLRF